MGGWAIALGAILTQPDMIFAFLGGRKTRWSWAGNSPLWCVGMGPRTPALVGPGNREGGSARVILFCHCSSYSLNVRRACGRVVE